MMRPHFVLSLLAVLIASTGLAQEITQTIRGSIKDKDTQAPMIGANVALYRDSTLWGGNAADVHGNYRIENVPIGRYTVVTSSLGYQQGVTPNVIVSSGKEIILHLEMEESLEKLTEVEIVAEQNKGETLNKMATVSAREFSVEESERYAGSRGDPARMA